MTDASPLGITFGLLKFGATPNNAATAEFISALGSWIALDSLLIESEWRVNTVFHLAGPFGQAEFVGVRSGTFSRVKRVLMVQIAITESFKSEAHMKKEVLKGLRSAISLAEEFLADEGISVDARAPIRQIKTALRHDLK